MTSEWLRLNRFAGAPSERVLSPRITSTIFPRLPPPGRRVFRVCLVVMLTALLTLAALRITPALIAVGALGVPLLFALYLRECDIHREIPRGQLALSVVLGAALGVAAMLTTGKLVADSYEVSIVAGMAVIHYLRHGLGIPLAASLLKLVPAAVVRLLSRPPRMALDGFAVGAAGALAFSAAATLTRLAPQFALGAVASSRSVSGLIVEAAISGFTVPLAGAASGGTVGAALWFTPDPAASPQDRRRARVALAVLAVAVVLIFVGVVITDVAGLSQWMVLTIHLLLAFAALAMTRVALQIALVHEAHDPAIGPLPEDSRPTTPLRRLLALWTAGVATAAGALVGLSAVVTAKPQTYRCPPDCGQPPVGIPVTALPRFLAPDGAFSVAYPAAGTAYDVKTEPAGVTAKLTVGDGGVLGLFSEPARGRDSRTIAMDFLKRKFPDVKVAYEIPNAMVGYQPGFGVAADRWPQSSSGKFLRVRILLLVAVKNDLALAAVALGPYHQYGPSFGPGLPSGAGLQVALDMGKYVNSFRWKGDPQD